MILTSNVNKSLIGNEYLGFTYVKQPIKDSEVKKWRDQGYTHSSFTGALYGGKNPMPKWVTEVSDMIGLKNCGYTFYRMDTLDIMPPHKDHFETYSKIFNVNRELAHRAIVFLEDWKPGHYFEYNGELMGNWRKGEYVLYSADIEHAASNIGIKPRYTLQITGTYE